MKAKSPLWRRWWFWVALLVFFFVGLFFAMEEVEEIPEDTATIENDQENESTNDEDEIKEESGVSETDDGESKTIEEAQSELEEAWEYARDNTQELGRDILDTFRDVWRGTPPEDDEED